MARIVQSITSSTTDAPVTISQVNSLIQATTDWELISVNKITSSVAQINNTFDTSKYIGMKVLQVGGIATSSVIAAPTWTFLNSGLELTTTNVYGYSWNQGYSGGFGVAAAMGPQRSDFSAALDAINYTEYEMMLTAPGRAHLKWFTAIPYNGGNNYTSTGWGTATGNYNFNGTVFKVGGGSYSLNNVTIYKYGRRIRG
jgi:hypothetical protein